MAKDGCRQNRFGTERPDAGYLAWRANSSEICLGWCARAKIRRYHAVARSRCRGHGRPMPSRRRILHDNNRGESIDCPTTHCRCVRAGVAAEVTGSPEAIAYWTSVWSEVCQITTAAVVRHAAKRALCRLCIGSRLFPAGDLAACQYPVPPVFQVDFAAAQSERSHGLLFWAVSKKDPHLKRAVAQNG